MSEIKDYYVIGDLHTVALVSRYASIDWMCVPKFDSPSIFAKLLDKNAGSFYIDIKNYKVTSKYIDSTAIIEFLFTNSTSEFLVRDFMVPQQVDNCDHHFLVRKFIGIKGTSKIKLIFNPKPEYAKQNSNMNFIQDIDMELLAGDDSIFIYPPKNSVVSKNNGKYEIEYTLGEDEETTFVMEYSLKHEKPRYKNQDYELETREFWHKWIEKGSYFDFHKKDLIRSAITLKLMQYYPTGAIVAAPTTSLPEALGGVRNWDYRYVWIRDATFTLYALYVLGYTSEAVKFFDFLQEITEQSERDNFDISLMYTIDGQSVHGETKLNYFSGYKNSQPVRVGNGATNQFQLDVYGSLIDAYYFVSKRGVTIDDEHKKMVINLVETIKLKWMTEDHGIWEVRSGKEQFAYSKVMCWVGVNRALRMKNILKLTQSQVEEFEELEKDIYDWIWENCYDNVQETFVQYPNSKYQDATNLLFVLIQFLNKHDPLTKKIIDKTCSELSRDDVYVYRYLSEDGLKGKEGAFVLCSFWLISAWAIIEDTEKAEFLFNKFRRVINDQGLLAEEIDVESGEYLGNYPQAFSHIGYIMSIYFLNRYK